MGPGRESQRSGLSDIIVLPQYGRYLRSFLWVNYKFSSPRLGPEPPGSGFLGTAVQQANFTQLVEDAISEGLPACQCGTTEPTWPSSPRHAREAAQPAAAAAATVTLTWPKYSKSRRAGDTTPPRAGRRSAFLLHMASAQPRVRRRGRLGRVGGGTGMNQSRMIGVASAGLTQREASKFSLGVVYHSELLRVRVHLIAQY